MISLLRLPAASLACAAVFVFCSLTASAQVTTGTIYGVVTDPQGGAMPGVVVDATHIEAGTPRTATTDASGVYRLAGLPVGRYRVVSSLQGFTVTEALVTVNVGTNVPLDMKLRIAPVIDTVTVEAQAPRVSLGGGDDPEHHERTVGGGRERRLRCDPRYQ
jgi:hypothetical protein